MSTPPYTAQLSQRMPSFRELQQGTAAPPLIILNNQQTVEGMRYRVVRSLIYLDLRQTPIGPTASRDATEDNLSQAFHTLLQRVRDAVQARQYSGPTLPVHVRFRMEAIEHSPVPGEPPRPFWVSMSLTVSEWGIALREIRDQIAARYSDDGYLDELGSDHDTQNQTYVMRIECEMLMSGDGLGNGGCGTSNHECWVQSTNTEQKQYFRVLPVRSTDNNCGIACLSMYALQGGWVANRKRVKYNALRAQLGIAHGVLLSYDELDRVAENFATNYIVYDMNGYQVHVGNGYAADAGRCAQLLIDQGHYRLILARVGQCACGKPDGEGHICKYKGGFCMNCQTHHPNMAHDCPYSQENIAARAVQDLAAAALRRQQEERDSQIMNGIDARLNGMENREDFEPILECVFKLKRSCIVIGPGGVGKTFVALREVRGVIEDSGGKVKVFTPTGQAATLHADATTAHYGLKLRTGTDSLSTVVARLKPEDFDDWETVTHLLLDEISMFDAALVDLIDLVCRHLKHRPSEPFGGVQLVGVGDFLQLKPINAIHLFFDSQVIRTMLEQQTMGVFYLNKPVRYPNVKWFDLLCRVRIGKPNGSDVARLKVRTKTLDDWCALKQWNEQTMPVLACPKNKEADDFNTRCASMLKAQGKQVARFVRQDRDAAVKQNIPAKDLAKLAPRSVELIVDCKVMLLINISRGKCSTNYLEQHQVGNGSVGWVRAFGTLDDPGVLVEFKNGAEVWVGYHCYENLVEQLPLRMAYASSIHKLQGTSLDEALLSLAGCFCEAQAYAALSRVCAEECCYIVSMNVNALRWVDQRCIAMSVASTKKPLPRLEITEMGEWTDPMTETPYMKARVHTLPRGEDMTTSKVIYFDAETFHNSKGELEAYHMEVLRMQHGRSYRKRFTKSNEDHDVLCDFGDYIVDIVTHDVEAYNNSPVRGAVKLWLERPFILAAFNGANFDFHMLIKYLFQSGLTMDFKVNMMFKGNTVAYFDLWHVPTGKQCIVLHDLCRILQCSLAKASKDMLGINLKGMFPHKHMNRWGYLAVLADEQPRHVVRADFFEKDFGELDKLYGRPDDIIDLFPVISNVVFDVDRKFESASIDLHATLMHYGGADVDVLRLLYAKVDKTVMDTFKASVMNFYSANQMSRYGVLSHLPRHARLTGSHHGGGAVTSSRKFIDSQLFCLTKEQDGWVTDAMYGGRTLPRQTHFKSRHLASFDAQDLGMGQAYPKELGFEVDVEHSENFYNETDALLFVDIFSMYVSIMKTQEFSYGKPAWMNESQVSALQVRLVGKRPFNLGATAEELIKGELGHFILDVDLSLHPMDVEPPVPYRSEGQGHHGRVLWDSKRRRGKYTHVDVGLALRNGGVIHAIYGGLRWPFAGRIFEEYMNTTLRWKQEGEDAGNEALRSFGKLCGNTVFGGMCMRTHSNAVAMCLSDAEIDLFLKENTWEGAYGYADGMLIWGKRKSYDDDGLGVQVYSPTAKQVGCLVLAYAREVIDTFTNAANPMRGVLMRNYSSGDQEETHNLAQMQTAALKAQPYYGDTDSLIIHASQYKYVKRLLKDEPGFWTDDLHKKWETKDPVSGLTVRTMALVLEYYGAAPKSYGIRYVLPTTRNLRRDDALFIETRFPLECSDEPAAERLICEYDMSCLREKFKFKGVPKGCPVNVDGTVYDEMNLSLLRTIMLTGIAHMDADDEALPDDRPRIELSSIGKVGIKPTSSDYFAGIAPFSLKPVAIRRSLFQTRFVGRKIALRKAVPASALINDILAPLSFAMF